MLVEVASEEAKERMGVAVGVHGSGEAPIETVDGHSHCANGLLGGVGYAWTIDLLVIVERFEVAHCLKLDRLDLVVVFQKGFELGLGAEDGSHGCGGVQGRTALLDS